MTLEAGRLAGLINGIQVYLYSFVQGVYEDRRHFLCAHVEQLSESEIFERLQRVSAQLPEKIEIDFTAPEPEPDLFERALKLAGFVIVDDALTATVRMPAAHPPVESRGRLEALIKIEMRRVK